MNGKDKKQAQKPQDQSPQNAEKQAKWERRAGIRSGIEELVDKTILPKILELVTAEDEKLGLKWPAAASIITDDVEFAKYWLRTRYSLGFKKPQK